MDDEALVGGIVASPLGATLLRILEGFHVDWSSRGFDASSLGSAPSIGEAAEAVTGMTQDDVVSAMLSASSNANPWSGAPEEVTRDLAASPARRAIAEALVAEHGPFLTAALDREAQVLWRGPGLATPTVGDLTPVYECGEFPWGGLRTHTELPSRHDRDLWVAHDGGQQMDFDVWRLPVRHDARIAEIDSPRAWLELVRRHPVHVHPFRSRRVGLRRELASGHNAWDIRLRSVEADGTATVQLIDGSHRSGVRGLLMPDWTSVADEYDGVHLSWAGFLLAEGTVVDAGDGWLAVARFWGSELTVFLSDVFDNPTPTGERGPR